VWNGSLREGGKDKVAGHIDTSTCRGRRKAHVLCAEEGCEGARVAATVNDDGRVLRQRTVALKRIQEFGRVSQRLLAGKVPEIVNREVVEGLALAVEPIWLVSRRERKRGWGRKATQELEGCRLFFTPVFKLDNHGAKVARVLHDGRINAQPNRAGRAFAPEEQEDGPVLLVVRVVDLKGEGETAYIEGGNRVLAATKLSGIADHGTAVGYLVLLEKSTLVLGVVVVKALAVPVRKSHSIPQ
jgi:hypothetical protein